MNKAFDKIIERIDKEIPVYTGKAKQIVQEVAEEYNGGWIACSERLPNQGGEFTDVLITCESMEDGVFVQSAEFYISSYGEPIFDALYHYERVLAWKPLPEPFKERD